MSQFMQQNFLLYGMAVAGVLGVVSQVILRMVYDKLIRDMEKPAFAKGKYMKHLKQRYNIYRRTQTGADSINIFIQKSMMEYKYMGMNLHTWRRMGMYVLVLCAAIGIGGWYLAGSVQMAETLRQNYLWGILANTLLIAGAYGVTDTGYRRKYLETGLRSLFTNSSTQAAQTVDLSEAPSARGNAPQETRRRRSASAGEENKGELKVMQVQNYTEAERRSRQVQNFAEAEPKSRQEAGRDKAALKAAPEASKKRSKIIETKAQRDKRELKANLAKMKEGMAETAAAERQKERSREQNTEILRQMDPLEQERVIREVLKEFL